MGSQNERVKLPEYSQNEIDNNKEFLLSLEESEFLTLGDKELKDLIKNVDNFAKDIKINGNKINFDFIKQIKSDVQISKDLNMTIPNKVTSFLIRINKIQGEVNKIQGEVEQERLKQKFIEISQQEEKDNR